MRTSNLPHRRSTLRPNKSFKGIDFSDNKLEDIPSGYLNHTIKLEVLNFSHNSMKRVPIVRASRALRCKNTLRKLYLDNNNINLEGKLQFVHLNRLNVLNMKNNDVGRIQLTTFRGLCRLTHLDLSNNQIAYVHFVAFRHMVILKELDLSGNRLTSLGRHVFPRLSQLKFLHLSSNLLMKIPGSFFSRLIQLQTLDISRNAFETLTSTQLRGISYNLRNLTASDNRITTFASNFFKIFVSLHKLQISGNPIKCMPRLSNLGDLMELHITETQITHIYPCDLEGLDKLDTLFWFGSPIACDCQNIWMRTWYDNQMNFRAKQKTEAELPWNCHSPPSTVGLTLHGINISQISCTRKEEYCYAHNKCHGKDLKGDDLFPGNSDEDSEEETNEGQVTEGTKNQDTEGSTTEISMKISTARNLRDEDIFNRNDTTTQETFDSTDRNRGDRTTKKLTTLNIDLPTNMDYDNQTGWVVMWAKKEDDALSGRKSGKDDISLLYNYKLLFVMVCTISILVIITCICCAVLYVMKKKKKWFQDKDNKVHVIADPKKNNLRTLYGGHMRIAPPSYEVNGIESTCGLGNVRSIEAMFEQNLWNNEEKLYRSNKY